MINQKLIIGILVTVFVTIFTSPAVFAENRIYDEVVGVDKNGNVESLTMEKPKVGLSKHEIYHYDILTVHFYNINKLDADSLYMRVYKNGKVHLSLGMVYDIPFIRDQESDNTLKAVYLPDWNERAGYYEIKLFYRDVQLETDSKIIFSLKRRNLPEIKKGISIVDLETNSSIKTRKFTGPSGLKTDYSAIINWAKFMKADALWILAGETTSFKKRDKEESPWDPGPLENLDLLKKLADGEELDIGAYVMSFYVPGKLGVPERYESGLGYNSEKDYLYRSRHISLGSEKRISDIIELVKSFQNEPGIKYIGLDFIRTGRADGYELAPLVIDETNIETPVDWYKYGTEDKIKWFANKIEVEKDPVIIEKWRWWRASKVALITKRIIKEAHVTKPVWVFTLAWNHGKEHGQDPVMFFDAGVSIDAVMLYEANSQQFSRLLKQWKNYISEGEGNIIIGNCIDYNLLDSDIFNPPQELYRRNITGYKNIIKGGIADGIFVHDLARAFWGRRGGFSIEDYAVSHISSVYSLKKDLQAEDFVIDVNVSSIQEYGYRKIETRGFLDIKYSGKVPINRIHVELFSPRGQTSINYFINDPLEYASECKIDKLEPSETKRVEFLMITDNNYKYDSIRFKIEIGGDKEYYITKLLKLEGFEKIVKK
jgi:hypothetical protein